jgi:hypothetical protein
MKKPHFYPLRRFLSLLILDRDIVGSFEEVVPEMPPAQKTPFEETHTPHQVAPREIPEWEQEDIIPQEKETNITIQPEEIGGIEDIDTRVY